MAAVTVASPVVEARRAAWVHDIKKERMARLGIGGPTSQPVNTLQLRNDRLLGTLVAELVRSYERAESWDAFVNEFRGRSYLSPELEQVVNGLTDETRVVKVGRAFDRLLVTDRGYSRQEWQHSNPRSSLNHVLQASFVLRSGYWTMTRSILRVHLVLYTLFLSKSTRSSK